MKRAEVEARLVAIGRESPVVEAELRDGYLLTLEHWDEPSPSSLYPWMRDARKALVRLLSLGVPDLQRELGVDEGE